MDKINREDMLELTRRMTLKRNCFGRVAGGYYDEDGNLEDSFNVHFRNLPIPDQRMLLEIAKSIPFAKTNEQLKEHRFTETEKSSSAWKTMMQLIRCELKNNAMLENIYEALGIDFFRLPLFLFICSLDVCSSDQIGRASCRERV